MIKFELKSLSIVNLLKQSKFWRDNILLIYLFFFLIIIYFSYIDDFKTAVLEIASTKLNNFLCVFVSKIYISLCLIGGAIYIDYFIFRTYIKRGFSLKRLFIALISLTILITQNQIYYAPTVLFGVSYFGILLSFPITLLCEELYKTVALKKEPKFTSAKFISNLPLKSHIEPGRVKYASTLVDMMLNTNVSEESYAIGIVGDWGSGKTTFSNHIAEQLDGKFLIIRFFPWDCTSATDIMKSFFNLLNDKLSYYNKDFHNLINSYLKELISFVGRYEGFISPLVGKGAANLQQLKENIENCLLQLNRPVLIIIDDIDRLEGSELFETVRIIRNSANFKNVFYIASYDKDYVTSQFALKGINAQNYLEKIFPIEIYLPHCEEYSVIESLRSALRQMVPTAEANSILDKLSEQDNRCICHILSTFRRAKNFANSYSIDLNYLITNNQISEIDKKDLLFIELIKFSDAKIYDSLRKYPDRFLYVIFDKNRLTIEYHLRKGVFGEKVNDGESDFVKFRGEIITNKDIKYLLKNLFSGNRRNRYRISLADHFSYYFTLYPSERAVSETEFRSLIESNNSKQRQMIHNWCNRRARKSATSICCKLVTREPRKLSRDEHYAYFKILTLWLIEEPLELEYLSSILLAYMTFVTRREDERYFTTLKYAVQQTRNNVLMAHCLVRLLSSEALIINAPIDVNQLKELLTLNVQMYIQNNKCDAIDLLKDTTSFHHFFAAHSKLDKKMSIGVTMRYTNLVFEQIYDYYSSNKSKNYRELSEIKMKLKNSDDKNKYERVFGNINSELDCFITDCFLNPS